MGRGHPEGVTEENGGYVTRGRAAELERQYAALEARVNKRLYELEQRVRKVEALPVAVLRAQAQALIEVIQTSR